MNDLTPPGAVRWICRTLEEAGFETWAVGGAVRDALVGRSSGDWDLTTAAHPGTMRRLFTRTVPIGVEHGTVGILARDGTMYEVTTFRRDVETTGRHAVVAFADSLDEDLARRDFTINAVAWHPLRGVLHDPFQGRRDLEARVLRTVGDPSDRFAEDYLRVLRALRFAGAYRLQVQSESWHALVRAVPRMGVLSPERVREEMEKILSGRSPPSASLSLYGASGALGFFYPELDRIVEVEGSAPDGSPVPPHRDGDLWSHALRTVDLLPRHRSELRWAALLGGIGVPTGSMGAGEEGEPPGRRGLLRAAALLRRLRSSNARTDTVAGLVEWIRAVPAPGASDAVLREWLAGVERERLSSIVRIWLAEARADRLRGRGGSRGGWVESELVTLVSRLREVARSGTPLSVGELALSGRDLIRLGYRPGPYFGDLLDHLLATVLEDPDRNTEEALIPEVHRWMELRTSSAASHGSRAEAQRLAEAPGVEGRGSADPDSRERGQNG